MRSAAVRAAVGSVVLGGVLAGALGATGCSGGDSDGGGNEAAERPRPTPAPASRAAVLVDRLGCRSGEFRSDTAGEWFGVDVRDCEEGAVVARVYGSLTAEEREEAVRSLTVGDLPEGSVGGDCPEEVVAPLDLFLVTGPGWVTVAVGDDGASAAADALGGELRAEPLPVDGPAPDPFMCLPGVDLIGGSRAEPDTTGLRPGAAFAARLGCVSGAFTTAGNGDWTEADVVTCISGFTARVYASLTTPQRDAAVRLLAMQAVEGPGPSGGCVQFGYSDRGIHVVAGDTWVAAVLGEGPARDVAERFDGEVQPGVIDTPPASGYVGACLP
jgi:hypothetical protein